jgi:hypothetical protein
METTYIINNIGLLLTGQTIFNDLNLINSKLSTTTLKVTSGATSGYVLTSDTFGNANWVNPSFILNSTSGNTDTLNGVSMRNIYTRSNVINYAIGSDADLFSGSTNFGSRNFPSQFFSNSINYNSKTIHFRITGKWGSSDATPDVNIVTKFGSDILNSATITGAQANNHPAEILGEIIFTNGTAICCYSIGWCDNNGSFRRWAISDPSTPITVSGFTGGDFKLIMSGGTSNEFTSYLGYIQIWN